MFGQRKMEEKLLGGETLDQYVDHMFAHLDQNHDGQITLDEFIEGFKNDESIKALSQIWQERQNVVTTNLLSQWNDDYFVFFLQMSQKALD